LGPSQIVRKLASNAYVPDLPNNMSISPIFNVEDLTLCRGTFKPHSITFSAATGTQVPKLSPFS